jgi:hypothetical protein
MSKPVEFIDPITGKRCFTKHPEKFRDQGTWRIKNVGLLDPVTGKLIKRAAGGPEFPQMQWIREG